MKRWPVFVVAGSCRPELPLFVYRSGQEELFRELLPEFRMPPDTRHDLTHRSAVFFCACRHPVRAVPAAGAGLPQRSACPHGDIAHPDSGILPSFWRAG